MSAQNSPHIDAILAAIARLSPQERRSLQRRLRVSGLFVPDGLHTDQRRLQIAPALGPRQARQLRTTTPPPAFVTSAPPADPPDPYRSPVSGKIVVGAPADDTDRNAHGMQPVPGQAPEEPIVLIFDGGSKGNPGRGYGSYALRWPGRPQQIIKLQFGDHVTNNEAEYDTLIAALEAVLRRLSDSKADPATARVAIYGDSQLVVNQVRGAWKCEEPRMQLRRDRVVALLRSFGRWQITHHDRSKSVEVLGH